MNTKQQVREAVAAFSKSEDLEAAIEELLSSGFARAEISLLAGTEAVEQKLGLMSQRNPSLKARARQSVV